MGLRDWGERGYSAESHGICQVCGFPSVWEDAGVLLFGLEREAVEPAVEHGLQDAPGSRARGVLRGVHGRRGLPSVVLSRPNHPHLGHQLRLLRPDHQGPLGVDQTNRSKQ